MTNVHNITPHVSTGMRPFFLMFGRAPHLPANGLLGTPDEPEQSSKDWVTTHQERLKLAYEKATEKLQKFAEKRKTMYDKKAKTDVLGIGTHVYLRNRPMGRNKIHDAWDSDIHVIVDRDDVYKVKPIAGSQVCLSKHLRHRKVIWECRTNKQMQT